DGVGEGLAQAAQGGADGRLRLVHPHRGARDAALGHQRDQHAQQVGVDRVADAGHGGRRCGSGDARGITNRYAEHYGSRAPGRPILPTLRRSGDGARPPPAPDAPPRTTPRRQPMTSQAAAAPRREPSAATELDGVYRKIIWRLIPFLMLLWVLAWIDRVNIGFIKLTMLDELKWSEAVYGLGAGIFFLGYF